MRRRGKKCQTAGLAGRVMKRWSDEQLRAAVAASTSYQGVLRALDLAPSGGNHWSVKQRVSELGLETAHFRRATPPFDDRELRAAVAASTSYVTTLERLGVALTGGTYLQLRRRIVRLALDTNHFRRRRGGSRSWNDDRLRVAVASSQSHAEVIRKLGLVPAGGNYVQVQDRIAALQLDVSHFTGRSKSRRRVAERSLDEVLVAGRFTGSHKLKLRLFRAGLKRPACESCGWAERAPDGRIPVELDHINGDKRDNRIENLRVLCPNCHALQPTHRGLNRGSRRIRTDT